MRVEREAVDVTARVIDVGPQHEASGGVLRDLHARGADQAVAEIQLALIVDRDSGGVDGMVAEVLESLEPELVAGQHVVVVAAGARGGDRGLRRRTGKDRSARACRGKGRRSD